MVIAEHQEDVGAGGLEASAHLAEGAQREAAMLGGGGIEPAGEAGRVGEGHGGDDLGHGSASAAASRGEAGLELQGPGRLFRIGALVGLERGMGVAVGGGTEEEAEDLGDVVLVHAQLVQAPHVLVAEGLVLGGAQPELVGEAGEVGDPPLAQRASRAARGRSSR